MTGKFWTAVVSLCLIGGSKPKIYRASFPVSSQLSLLLSNCCQNWENVFTWPGAAWLRGSRPVVGQRAEHNLILMNVEVIILIGGPWVHGVMSGGLASVHNQWPGSAPYWLNDRLQRSLDTIFMRRKPWVLAQSFSISIDTVRPLDVIRSESICRSWSCFREIDKFIFNPSLLRRWIWEKLLMDYRVSQKNVISGKLSLRATGLS